MPKFRKKPVVIEAVQFKPDVAPVHPHTPGLPMLATAPTGETFEGLTVYDDERGPFCLIQTLEGHMRLDPQDWLITGVKGERYPCKPDIFVATYEAADAPDSTAQLQEALAFAASVIKSGEPWTDECERIIGGALGH